MTNKQKHTICHAQQTAVHNLSVFSHPTALVLCLVSSSIECTSSKLIHLQPISLLAETINSQLGM